MNEKIFSFGLGIGTQNSHGDWLEVFYVQPVLRPAPALVRAISTVIGWQSGNQAIGLSSGQATELAAQFEALGEARQAALARQMADSKKPLLITLLEADAAPESVPEVYLKLHLLSHRLVQPHGTKLDGMFGVLPNVAWTNQGAIAIDELPARQLQARLAGDLLEVMSVDKFPKMTNYVVPAGVRIGDTDRVRLGAYLGEGTTVMHEGFVNFNAGTLGVSMVEGRISAGVVVGNGSDLGGGCSTMGTLSGGGTMRIAVGEECLLGANSGLGIPLGDRCTLEAGLYITAGTKVLVLDENNQPVETVKARDLAGKSDLLLRRNSITGTVECKTNKSAIALNAELHAHN